MTQTVRLTTAQALVKFLSSQYSERDGVEQRLVTGILGIFGHGNVAGVGQALLQAQVQGEEGAEGDDVLGDLPYYLSRNEQGAVHTATAFSRARNRRQVMAVTTSIGPGATNMVTGAALATTNRIPVLLLPVATSSPTGCPTPCSSSSRTPAPSTSPSTTSSGRCRASSTGSAGPSSSSPR